MNGPYVYAQEATQTYRTQSSDLPRRRCLCWCVLGKSVNIFHTHSNAEQHNKVVAVVQHRHRGRRRLIVGHRRPSLAYKIPATTGPLQRSIDMDNVLRELFAPSTSANTIQHMQRQCAH